MDEDRPNGAGADGHDDADVPTITITVVDRENFLVRVSGSVPNLDYQLNMLAQATREVEAQWRLQRAAVYQQQVAAAAEEAAIRRNLQRRQ